MGLDEAGGSHTPLALIMTALRLSFQKQKQNQTCAIKEGKQGRTKTKAQRYLVKYRSQERSCPKLTPRKGEEILGLIEANPAKIKAILDMGPPTNINEVQRLTGMMAALSRFISKSIEKGLPFFKILRKVKDFEWTEKCQQTFEYLKAYLAKPPLLVTPMPGDTLYLYMSSTPRLLALY
ncbi:hypothetical protein Sango_2863800 [Sesamum angolense]|uniref:Reverse transcriptase/retrotransposon-derived protein RNase H-like domain-containing protein n=1 Tax=Sesamum angolense TaxID=2727404 RepID=A0AAE1T6I0_9LAMI|nr:hypothetical protein Sango_2863800 [Sesamum angolense]